MLDRSIDKQIARYLYTSWANRSVSQMGVMQVCILIVAKILGRARHFPCTNITHIVIKVHNMTALTNRLECVQNFIESSRKVYSRSELPSMLTYDNIIMPSAFATVRKLHGVRTHQNRKIWLPVAVVYDQAKPAPLPL